MTTTAWMAAAVMMMMMMMMMIPIMLGMTMASAAARMTTEIAWTVAMLEAEELLVLETA